MSNFDEKELIDFIQTLEPQTAAQLTEWIEWEKEISWSNGYADAVDHYEYGVVNLVGEA
jgi:hypothetical protein